MKIGDIIKQYDVEERKGFDYYEIVGELNGLDDAEKSKKEHLFEVSAFSFVGGKVEDNPFGSFYGPQFTNLGTDGKTIYYPDISDVSEDTITYWEERARTSQNPLLVIRYAGLVWDFKTNITHRGQEPWLYRLYVDNMLKVCNENYCSHPIHTVIVLERLFAVARKNPEDLQKVKLAYDIFESTHVSDDSVRYWSSRFLLMCNNKKSFSSEEIEVLVSQHEERLKRLSHPDDDTQLVPWRVQDQANLLVRYYAAIQDRDSIRRLLNITERAFRSETLHLSPMQLMGNLEVIYRSYINYGFKEDARALSVVIQTLGNKVREEMKPMHMEFDIPPEVFQQADEMFGNEVESDEVRWKNFVVYFIPNKRREEVELKELVKKFPFKYMIGNSLMDEKGHPMSYVGPFESDPEGHLVLHMTEKLHLSGHFLAMAINRLLKTKTLTVEHVMDNMIIPSPIFEESRYNLIQEALQFFINGNYIVFNHLIVPQIESAIRNLVELMGAPILKAQRNSSGFQLRTLDELLREPCVAEIFTDDGALYLQLMLTNQKGFNIRNNLCHGLVSPNALDAGVAGWLLHILSMLGMLRFVEQK